MQQMIDTSSINVHDHTSNFLGYLDNTVIVHSGDDSCGKHWNPAIIEVEKIEKIVDGEKVISYKEIPVNSPRPLQIDRPMSMFARAYQGEISEITKAHFAKTQ